MYIMWSDLDWFMRVSKLLREEMDEDNSLPCRVCMHELNLFSVLLQHTQPLRSRDNKDHDSCKIKPQQPTVTCGVGYL